MHPYATLSYARTLAHVGSAVWVDAWQTFVIAREWKPGVFDALGSYPLACLSETSDLGLGIQSLRSQGLVSIALVVDGLTGPPVGRLQAAFGISRSFKTHYLVDQQVAAYRPSGHHRYEIQRASRRGVEVRIVLLRDVLDAWTSLYDGLITRHRISGLQQFTHKSFEALADCDGLVTVAAFMGEDLVSCHLWIRYGRNIWSHLAASSALGYRSGAAYAVYDHSIRSFPEHTINLGGSAGTEDAGDDGLARFKAGFANRTQDAYFFGEVLDAAKYAELCDERGAADDEYFPAYRTPHPATAMDARL
jgi:hypothetical protein